MTKSPRRLKQQFQETVGEQVRDLPLHAVRLAMFGVGRALLLGDRVSRDYKEITQGGGVKPVLGRLRDDVQNTAESLVGRVVERVRGEEAEPEPEPVRRTRSGPAASRTAGEEISVGKPGTATRPAPRLTRPGPPPKPPKRRTEPAEPKPEPAAQARPEPDAKAADTPKAAPKDQERPKAADEAETRDEAAREEKALDEKVRREKARDEKAFEPKPESKPAAQAEAEQLAKDLPVPDYDNATLPQLRARLRGLSVEQVKLLREYERKHAGREEVIRMYERRIAKLNGLH